MWNVFNFFKQAASDAHIATEVGSWLFAEFGGSTTYFLMKPQKPTKLVVYCHGAGDHALFPGFVLLFKLAELGFAVLAIDLPGHGPQSSSILKPDSVEKFLAKVFAELPTLMPVSDIHFVGHSLGGALAWHGVAHGTIDVRSLTIIGVPRKLDLGFHASLNEVVHCLDRNYFALIRRYGLWPMLPALGPWKRKDFPIRSPHGVYNTFGYVRVMRSLVEQLTMPTELASPNTPVLAIYGTNDQIAPMAYGETLLAGYSRSRLIEISGKNHFCVMFDPRLHESIATFIDQN